ncbi:hypothetical protein [Kiloniella sp.]|uniref:hypothetical protein n=1 Tax=Kiloniella sp. TaxID=1938587 RepID=UPI003B01C2FB
MREFLNEFAGQDFLGDEIPVLGFSFNELMDITGRFSDAVDDITNNEPFNVQQLEQKLRESFGLPPGAGFISLALVDDMDVEGDADSFDMLQVALDLSRSFTEVLTLDLDLDQSVAPFGDLSLLGRAGMGASVVIDAILTVGVDLDDDDGDILDDTDNFGEVFLFTHEDDTHINLALNGTSTDITFNASLGPLGVAIIGGDGSFDLEFGFSNTGAGVGDKASIDDPASILATFGDFDADLPSSSMVLNLPVFFPTPSDYIGDIAFDASLIIDGVDGLIFDGSPSISLPSDLSLPDFYTSFGILNSLPLAIDGLDLLLENLQNILGSSPLC